MDDMPLVSIVLPVWNGERYLSQALESIISQSYDNIELIIVNDCSTDKSLSIIKSYAAKDTRIRVCENPTNLKLPASLNNGFTLARGSYYTWTSDDNLLGRDFIKTMLHELQNSDADLVYSDFNAIDSNGNFINISPVGEAEGLISQNTIGASFLYKRAVHDVIGGYDVQKFLYEDYDFWVRAYLKGFKFKKLDCVVYQYRRHDATLTSTRPMPVDYPMYRFNLRRKFTSVSKQSAYDAREILLGYRRELGAIRTMQVLVEAIWINPIRTIKYCIPKIKKLPTKLARRFTRWLS